VRQLLNEGGDFRLQLPGPLGRLIEAAHVAPQPAELNALREPLERLVERLLGVGVAAQLHLGPQLHQPQVLVELVLANAFGRALDALVIFACPVELHALQQFRRARYRREKARQDRRQQAAGGCTHHRAPSALPVHWHEPKVRRSNRRVCPTGHAPIRA
jgi:hypothetical protein